MKRPPRRPMLRGGAPVRTLKGLNVLIVKGNAAHLAKILDVHTTGYLVAPPLDFSERALWAERHQCRHLPPCLRHIPRVNTDASKEAFRVGDDVALSDV